MNKKAKCIFSLLFSCIIIVFFYTFLHEGGHALVAIMCGGKVDKMALGLNAHVQTSGASFTIFSEALFSSAGVLLPVLFLIIALVFYNPEINNILYHISYGFLSLIITGSLLAWVIIPIISLFTLPPAGDDVTKLLDITHLYPLTVALTALLIIVSLVFFIYKKELFGKIKDTFCELVISNQYKHSKIFRVYLIIGIVLGSIIVAAGLNILMPKTSFEKSLSIEVNSTTNDVKLPFKVERSKLYSMELGLEAKGILTDIQIYSEDGTMIYQNVCEWFTIGTSLNLKKGNYVIVLTFLKNPMAMQEHFKVKGYNYKADTVEQLKDVYEMSSLADNYQVSFSAVIK